MVSSFSLLILEVVFLPTTIMISRLRAFANSVVTGIPEGVPPQSNTPVSNFAQAVPYSRPEFLSLTDEEVQVSADHSLRPILVPRDIAKLPWHSGYAE